MKSWGEQYVDAQIDAAWTEFRTRLADRFAVAIEVGGMDTIGVAADGADDNVMAIWLREDGRVVVKPQTAKRARCFTNVDEAAHKVARVMREDWQVVHPAFLYFDADHGLVDVPVGDDPLRTLPAPEIGMAESPEELHDWVVRAFQPDYDEPVVVDDNGYISFREGEDGPQVLVAVRNEFRIEVWHVFTTDAEPAAIRSMVDDLAPNYQGIRFHREERSMVMSLDVMAHPFARDQVRFAVGQMLHLADELSWVGGRLADTGPRQVLPPRPGSVPARLAGLMANANRVTHGLLIEAIQDAAQDGDEIRRWRAIARREIRAARRLPRGDSDPYRLAHRVRRGWARLEKALDDALVLDQAGEAA